MKIGILTYHRAENYGALLQAYALMTYLSSIGHDVSFVDYWPKYHSDYFKLFSWKKFLHRSLSGKAMMLMNLMPSKFHRKRNLQRFMLEHLHLPQKVCYQNADDKTEHFDAVLYGSDQIWRKQKLGGVDFDPWYFGAENVQADKRIAYAGSMGAINTTASDDDYVKAMMKNFDHVSVRESDLYNYLAKLEEPSELVCDPVFLLTKEQWRSIKLQSSDKEKYILFYNLLNTYESVRFAEKLSQKTGLAIREVNKQISPRRIGKRYISSASVEQFLQLIDGAEYVVSNSFHGVAFSLIFQKQFFAVGMGARANRVVSLLNNIGIGERYVNGNVKVDLPTIDYAQVNAQIENLVRHSKQYIKESLFDE